MNQLAVVCATLHWKGWEECRNSWIKTATDSFSLFTIVGMKLPDAFQRGLEMSREPIVGLMHDDLVVNEAGWDQRVIREFDDPTVGLVGFGGALCFGTPDIYRTPYWSRQVERRRFVSNMRDAEVHGQRFAGELDVAVLDGYAMFARREILVQAGGWPIDTPIGYFMYDSWLCCESWRQGFRTRMVGVAIDHLGWKSGGMKPGWRIQRDKAQRYIYDKYRDILPLEAK